VFVNFMSILQLPASPNLLAFSTAPLAHLRLLDIAVIAIYFAMVLWIGFYLKAAPTPAKSSSWPAAR
jgi:hypothetical protein